MPSLIYTKNTSGAIRRLRNKKPTKGYLSALIDHIKFIKKKIMLLDLTLSIFYVILIFMIPVLMLWWSNND